MVIGASVAHRNNHANKLLDIAQEARLLAEINNPNVANLLEVNEEAGTHYLVLEFVQGTNLGLRLRTQGPLPQSEALAIESVLRPLGDFNRETSLRLRAASGWSQ